jgi:hypothetical protein
MSLFMPCVFLGTGAVALWAYLRFPRLRPQGLVLAVGHVGISFATFSAAPFLVHAAATAMAAPYLIAFDVGVIVVPMLGYVLLSWIWLIARIHDLASGGPDGGHLVGAGDRA